MKLKVILAGSTGMVGKGVLYECLRHPEVESVLVINRRTLEINHPKVREIIHQDLSDLSPIREELGGYDVCFFCVGSVSLKISKEDYYHVTHDLTLHMATTLLKINAGLTFIYISGLGADSGEKSRIMRMRVKGEIENSLLALPLAKAFMFRPGYIQPKHGVRSSNTLYRVMYSLFAPLYPILKWLFPKIITSTELLGKAMINTALAGHDNPIVENREINLIAEKP